MLEAESLMFFLELAALLTLFFGSVAAFTWYDNWRFRQWQRRNRPAQAPLWLPHGSEAPRRSR